MVANIPYHITSPLLHTFLEGERPPELTVLLVQLEVAERVAAPPGRMSYLSVFAQNVATAEVVARVPAAAFEPAPAVDSAVLRLRRREHPVGRGRGGPRTVLSGRAGGIPAASQAGPQRPDPRACRWTARSSRRHCSACGVDPERRPQTLSVDEWACLTGRARAAPVSAALRLDAPAKLNLTLSVVGRRPDGYHLLESDLVLLELADRLLLMSGGSGLRLEGEGVDTLPLGEENLAWRGLRAGLGGPPELAWLALDKRIPVAAGLGGGSSDAAAAWRLGRAWRELPDEAGGEELGTLAGIGADVPFFASACGGRAGERHRRADRGDRARATPRRPRTPIVRPLHGRGLRRAAARRVGPPPERPAGARAVGCAPSSTSCWPPCRGPAASRA